MRLTILGEYGPYPPAGGACSGYLLSRGETHVLMDCGPGVLARLQQVAPIPALSAVVLSHLHSDHMADLSVLRYALAALKRRGAPVTVPLPVFCPEEPAEEAGFLRHQSEFSVTSLSDGMAYSVAGLSFSFRLMTHPVPSLAMAVEAGGKRLVYSGDTRMNDRLGPMAAGADLFLCEAGCLHRELTDRTPHLSVRQAAELARDAGCVRTVLTHLPPEIDRKELAAEAVSVLPGAVLARALESYVL